MVVCVITDDDGRAIDWPRIGASPDADLDARRDLDARLIAAAPDLLAALKMLCARSQFISDSLLAVERRQAIAAIAKAEGK